MADIEVKTYVAKIADLLPSEENPREIGRKEYEALKKSLIEFPEMKQLREIVIDEDNQILAGHQRIYALKELAYEDVYVKQVFGLTKKQKREFMIKDNVSSGKWNTDIIANQWDLDELISFGVPKLKIPGADDSKEHVEFDAKDNEKTVSCPECGHEFKPSEQDD